MFVMFLSEMDTGWVCPWLGWVGSESGPISVPKTDARNERNIFVATGQWFAKNFTRFFVAEYNHNADKVIPETS